MDGQEQNPHGVRDTCRVRATCKERVAKKRVEGSHRGDVEVQADAAEVVEQDMPNCVGTLDGVQVRSAYGEEQGVLCCEKVKGRGVGPELKHRQ